MRKNQKSNICLVWKMSKNRKCLTRLALFTACHKDRMLQNFDVFDFTLKENNMEAIRALDEAESLFFSHYDPKTVEMLTGLHR